MRKGIGFVALVLGFMLFLPDASPAAVISLGDPLPTGSWSQRFQESGVGPFNRMEIFMNPGVATFKGTGFDIFSPLSLGWSGSCSANGLFASAWGGNATLLQFNIHFSTDPPAPLSFYFYAFNSGAIVEAALASWNGRGWCITAADPAKYPGAPVPEPGALILLGTGLVALAWYGNKRVNRK